MFTAYNEQMNMIYVFRLAILQLTARASGSLISLLLFGIGIAMISFLILASKQIDDQIKGNLAGIDLVAGAKGSPLQLILSSVMHIDYPTGNISLAEAEQLGRHPMVRETIPIALGDNYMGFRIVGTTLSYANLYEAGLSEGLWHEKVLEVTIGYHVAKRTGLSLGDTFTGVHGFQSAGHTHDDHEYTVTGIMARTGLITDNLILTAVESVWKVHDQEYCDNHHDLDHDHYHDHDHSHDGSGHRQNDHSGENGGHHHDQHPNANLTYQQDHHQYASMSEHHDQHQNEMVGEILRRVEEGEDISAEEMAILQRQETGIMSATTAKGPEITAMLIMYRGPAAAIQLPRHINENTNMQAASPALELHRLLSLLGYGFKTLKVLAWIIIIISAINIFIHLYNSLRQGLFELALMRVSGAGKGTIFVMVLLQGVFLAIGGWALGLIISRGIWLALPAMQVMASGEIPGLSSSEFLLLLYATSAGALAAAIPASMTYNTDVHFTLRNNGRI
jgi:putative ABC transport system permease protein